MLSLLPIPIRTLAPVTSIRTPIHEGFRVFRDILYTLLSTSHALISLPLDLACDCLHPWLSPSQQVPLSSRIYVAFEPTRVTVT